MSVEDKFEFERILEDRINIWNQIGGYGYGESKFEEGYLEYVIHSDKPLNSTHINSEFERIDTKYKIISIDFVEPVYNKYRGMSGSSSH